MYSVEFQNITKSFGRLVANDDISLSVKRNSVHCILGENGAGKSTLMKMLFGVYKPDKGEILINGVRKVFSSPLDAIASKIGMLYQHFMLIEDFTVLENIILGKEISRKLKIDFPAVKKELSGIIGKYNLGIDLESNISDLSISEQQKVELLKILYRNAEILILDEPTAVLSPVEVKEFYKIIKNFLEDGRTIILITHKLAEVKEIAETVTILRKGRKVFEIEQEKMDIAELSRQIIGDVNIGEKFDTENVINEKEDKEIINLRNIELRSKGKYLLNNLSFQVRKGEIVGICGVEGNGQNEVVDILSGLITDYKGKYVKDTGNISVVPDDRLKKGMIKEFSVGENILLRGGKDFFITRKSTSETEKDVKDVFDIKIPFNGCPMDKLSGGNQQKAIIAREVMLGNEFLIFSHPTRGVDIKASSFIYDRILEEKGKGNSILLLSSDLDELILLSDRILVFYKGSVLKEYDRVELKRSLEYGRKKFLEEIGKYMIGVTT